MKVSDYIAKRLVDYGVRDVFMITGGGAMHLNDSVGNHPELHVTYHHHEQAASIAAEGYFRVSGKPAAVLVTTGPGGTNAITGLLGQWTDSIPAIYISGQVKQATTIASCPEWGVRQLGDQEVDIISVVRPLTKYAKTVTQPLEIKQMMDTAWRIATTGRMGPVWIDVPMDIQGAIIDEEKLMESDEMVKNVLVNVKEAEIHQVIELLTQAKRPVLLAGHGIRLAGAQGDFLHLIEQLGIPVLSTFNGFDLIPSNHPLYVGRIGTIGDRAGNFALQNADLLLSIGSRNNIRQVSYDWSTYARHAKKIIVDIDEAELNKPTVKPDLPIHADAGHFIRRLQALLQHITLLDWQWWREWTQTRKMNYPVVLTEYETIESMVHPYYFIKQLTDHLSNDAVVVAGNGTACVVLFQAGIVKKGQRIFWNSGNAAMGYDVPASIGASIATGNGEVICVTGDGSLQMNLQEFATVMHNQLPIKFIVLNNGGYLSIRQTQTNYFNGRYVGCDENSGISFPDLSKIASAYGFPYFRIDSHQGLDQQVANILSIQGPVVCEVMLTSEYTFSPKLSSEKLPDGRMISKPLEDMYPFLTTEELASNMLYTE